MTQPEPLLRSLDDELKALRNVNEAALQVQTALDRTRGVLAPGRGLTADEAFIAACDLSAARSHLQKGLTYLSAAYTAARDQVPENLAHTVVVIQYEPTEETHP